MKSNRKAKKITSKIKILLILFFLTLTSSLAFAGENTSAEPSTDVIVQISDLSEEIFQLNSDIFLQNLEIDNYLINQRDSSIAVIKQIGDLNSAVQNQKGIGNIAYIYQEGYNNSAMQNQYGNYNNAYAIQKGTGNTVIQHQYSNYNMAIVMQYGSNNIAEQYQGVAGGNYNKSIVIQSGNGNYVKVIQH